jgi:hypothetical protein
MNTPTKTVVVEKRVDFKVRCLQIAAILCALFAAAGISHGIHEANPQGGWMFPVGAGIIAATALAACWHVLIGSVVGMVRLSMIIALFIGGILLTSIALGASAQAIATAISGRAALAAELSGKVEEYNTALADAYVRATSWRAAADAANILATGLEGRAETEAGGGNGTGKGCGPKCSSLKDAAGSFRAGSTALASLLEEAANTRQHGEEGLGRLRLAAAAGDQNTFMAAVEEVAQAITVLNAVDPKPVVDNIGMVMFGDKGIDLSTETSDFRAKANAALANRPEVAKAPVFTSMTLGEATRKQVFGSALHGWILAGAIDVLPLLFLAICFVISREVWLLEDVERHTLTPAGRNDRDRKKVDDLRNGSNGSVVNFPSAAE